MERDEEVEFTPEGFQKVLETLDFLPEEQRAAALAGFVLGLSQ